MRRAKGVRGVESHAKSEWLRELTSSGTVDIQVFRDLSRFTVPSAVEGNHSELVLPTSLQTRNHQSCSSHRLLIGLRVTPALLITNYTMVEKILIYLVSKSSMTTI